MDIKNLVKRIIITLLIIIICFILQVSLFTKLELAGVTPNLLIIVITTFGFMYGQYVGIGVGFVSGIIMDMFFGPYFGFFSLIYMLIGFLSGFFRTIFYGDDLKLPVLLIGLTDIINGLAVYFIFFVSRGRINIFYYFKSVILPEAVYTVLIAVFLYYILLRINLHLDEENNRRSRRIV